MSGTYISNGARLGFSEAGAGAPVVFLHPTPLDHDYWRPAVSQMDGFRAIVPDLRGHGSSQLGQDLPAGVFSRVPDAPVLEMHRLAEDVLRLLDRLSIDDAIFVGCSIGGYVMLELWRQAHPRMRALAFICSKPQADTEAGLAKRVENIERVRAEGVNGFLDTAASSLPGATSRREKPWIVPEVRSRMTLTAEAVIAVQAGLAARPDSLSTVRGICVPVLSIAGGEDMSVSPAEMEAFREAPGPCESHVLPDAGHLAAFEQPETVAGLLSNWIGRING